MTPVLFDRKELRTGSGGDGAMRGGDGQIIHAANESTGVIISSLYTDYYSGHYYGAIRVI